MADAQLTTEALDKFKSTRGGWNRESAKKLGIEWPLKRGWKKRLLGKTKSELPNVFGMSAKEKIDALQTGKGGWNKDTLALLGVPWPPPRGWKRKLLAHEQLNSCL